MSPAFENAVDELPISSPIYPQGKEGLAKTFGESDGRVGFHLFLYEDEALTPVCRGLVGSSKEKFCIIPKGECSIGSHVHQKGTISSATLYVEIKRGSVASSPLQSALCLPRIAVFSSYTVKDAIRLRPGRLYLTAWKLTQWL